MNDSDVSKQIQQMVRFICQEIEEKANEETCQHVEDLKKHVQTFNLISTKRQPQGPKPGFMIYRGCLPDSKELAVKILKPSEDVLDEFVPEIEIITTLHHKNVISLIGFCYEDANLLLVYDFLSSESLEENLHGNNKIALVFGWNERYKVAMGVVEAFEYMHNNDGQLVIYHDVKSSNVLLSEDFEPHVIYL